MPPDVSAPLPDEPLAPDTTITVTLDDASAVIEKLNVYGVSPAKAPEPATEPFVPLFTYTGA